jgi:type VI secretion system ImpM family protein
MPDAEIVGVARGFWGKLPSRGDFCGAGLGRSFIAAWDCWVSAGIAASRDTLGECWQDAWMQAPVWFFQAPQGLFGDTAACGVWMPSVDRAGRSFPLVIAAELPAGTNWLAGAEAAGRAALEDLLSPDDLFDRIAETEWTNGEASDPAWWTAGSPQVSACRVGFERFNDAQDFAAMLKDTR